MPKILYEVDGVSVPSVTTVIGKYKDMGGLLHWYWKEGVANKPFNSTRDKAGEVGTNLHYLIQCYIKPDTPKADMPPLSLEDADIVREMFLRFKDWWDIQKVQRIIATEISLTSEAHLYGGTIDLVAERQDGTAIIMDWKTSKDFFQDMLLQLAAYRELCAECLQINIEKAYIVRLSKQNKGITAFPVEAQDMRHALEKFLALRRIYDMESHLTAVVERIRNDAKRHDNHQR